MTIAEGLRPAFRRPTRSVSAIAVGTLVWAALLVVAPYSADTAVIVSNVGLSCVALTGAAAALRRSRGVPDRRAWRLLGLGALAWGLGQVTWTCYEASGRDVPYPSYADVGYSLAMPLLVLGILALPGAPTSWSERVRLVLDGALIAASLLAMSWTLLLRDLINSESDNWAAGALSLAYPVGDVICGTLAVVSIARARSSAAVPLRTLLILCLGLLSFSVGDTGFALLTLQGTYVSGSLVDLGWFCGWALLGVAALQPVRRAAASTDEDRRRRAWLSTSAPYVPVLTMVGVNGWWRMNHDTFGRVVVVMLLFIVVLIVIRHVLTQRENDQLTVSLEARVEERTRALSGWEQWWRALVQNSTDVVTVLGDDGTVKYQTPSIRSVFGYDEMDLDGTEFADLFTDGDRARFRACLADAAAAPGEPVSFFGGVVHDDGRVLASESTVMSLLHDDAVLGLVVNTRDVSERSELESELNRRAFHDELTGLANRALFRNRLSHALESRSRLDRTVGVLFVDLDRFKEVNDTLGHAYGDELLCAIASRLVEMLRPGDTVARLGGDEFAVLLEHLGDPAEAEVVAGRLVELIEAPVRLRNVDVQVRASVGIALAAPDDAELVALKATDAADVILRNGDIAMYRAKSGGGGSWESFRPELHAVLMRRVEIEKELRTALRDGELSVVYQPTASVQDGRYVGVEALARWDSPRLGRITPAEFIPVAEDTGLIIELGAWVLRHACSQAAGWLANGLSDDFSLAVNVSGHQLLSADMVETVRSALSTSGLPGRHLVLEMTESVLLDRTEQTLARLHELKSLGIRLAIDDFGTGYSSLSYLSRFPVDVLKVDRSFIARIQQEDSNERELTRTIVQLGGSLDMLTVAEGVETPEQLATLRSLGCDLAQGYLFSEPRPGSEVERLLTAHAAPRSVAGSVPPAGPVSPSVSPSSPPAVAPSVPVPGVVVAAVPAPNVTAPTG